MIPVVVVRQVPPVVLPMAVVERYWRDGQRPGLGVVLVAYCPPGDVRARVELHSAGMVTYLHRPPGRVCWSR